MQAQRTPTRSQSEASRAGLTMIELMISIVILSVATFILSSTVTATVTHSITKAEKTRAVEAAMNKIEEIRALPQEDIFALYNGVAKDDPYGPGSAPGSLFSVPGLDPRMDPNGNPVSVGRVLLPGTDGILDETAVQPEFGLPRDLNGNLVIESGDVSDSYLVLPLIVRIEWNGRLGTRSFEMATMLADLAKWQE